MPNVRLMGSDTRYLDKLLERSRRVGAEYQRYLGCLMPMTELEVGTK